MSLSSSDIGLIREENIRLRRETFVFVKSLYDEVQPLIISVFKDFNLDDKDKLLELAGELVSKCPADDQLRQALLIFHQIVVVCLGELLDAEKAVEIAEKRLKQEGKEKLELEKEAIAQLNAEVLLSILGDIQVAFNIEKQVQIANSISGFSQGQGVGAKVKKLIRRKKA